jgi:manganese transport protein
MGIFTIKPIVQFLAWLITAVLVYLNLRMVIEQAGIFFAGSDSVFWKTVIIVGGLSFVTLLLIALFFPFFKKAKAASLEVHTKFEGELRSNYPACL